MKIKSNLMLGKLRAHIAVVLGTLLFLSVAVGARAAECVSITCPKDIVIECKSEKGAEVSFAPDASTTCGTTITVTCLPPSGSLFPIGTNLVNCAVSDPRGNMDRCNFFVIVTNTPPVIACPEDLVRECQSPLGATVTYSPAASAGCDAPVTITCLPPSGSVFPIGTNLVACVATDGFGRTDRCVFRVIVTNGPPTIICPQPVTINAGTNCKAIMPLLPITVLERCTPTNQLTFSQNPPAGTVLGVGVHDVTIWVSEGNHLDASCTTTVNVVDVTPPQIACPPSVWKYCAPNGTNASFDVTAKDTCGQPVLVTCEPPSGSFFPAGGTLVKCTATDAAGNSSQCSFSVNVTPASQLMSFVGGKKDNYAAPADPPHHSACLLTAAAGLSLGSSFDVSFSGRWLGHSFENLPGGIQWAKLRFKMRPKSNLASNDTVRVGAACGGGFSTWLWMAPIASLPEAGGKWTTNNDTYFTLDLSAMPGAPAALLSLLNLEITHRVDVMVGDDTVVDWVQLDVGACGVSGAAGGVPYMVKQGTAARGSEGGLRLYSDEERLPFDVDINVGKAEGIEIELGDWPGATNPPIDECTTPVSSYTGTKLEWSPYGTELCTVEFKLNPATAYTDLVLSQPTNIFGGRAIEVWRDGQMISRHFVEGGTGPGGVILYHAACVQAMGFGQGDFFLALSEMSSVSFVNAKHISGETEPMMGDFIRLIFNIPFTVGDDGPRADFDPDWVLNVKGRELDIRRIDVRKFGGLFDTQGEGVMSVGDDVVVAPNGTEEWTVSTCYAPAVKAGDENNTEVISLSLAELFVGKDLKPGAAFDLVATAEYGTTPPMDGVIGRMRCEIMSVNPLTTRFRVNYSDIGEETDLALFQLNNITVVPSHEELEVQGAPDSVKLFFHDNYSHFVLQFDAPWGVEVQADGQTVKEVETAWFTPRSPPPGVHGKPYRFCVTPLQAWEQKPITFTSPVMPTPPPPPLAPCVTLRCPTNVVKWAAGKEGVKVEFEIEARSACGTNVSVQCLPPSGSVLPVGVTWVQCHAADELGNSARCRFPVVVHDREPRLTIERAENGWAVLRWPVEFDDWQLERTRDLRALRWERPGRGSETDGVTRLRRLMVADPTVGDPSVGDPTGFFRLRAP